MYTKGEWKTIKDAENRTHIIAFGNKPDNFQKNICVLSVRSIEEVDANANLIVAAPDLYEALKQLVKQTKRFGVWCLDPGNKPIREVDGLDLSNNIAYNEAVVAIAKAEGRNEH